MKPITILVMGVCGTGKTTIGKALAEQLAGTFIDADDYHPNANIDKMHSGIPLKDEDRWPWLDAINQRLRAGRTDEPIQILACSALKEAYRQRLQTGIQNWQTCWLHGDRERLEARLQKRRGHFMPAQLLDSQLDDLEAPHDALRVDVGRPVDDIVQQIRSALAR